MTELNRKGLERMKKEFLNLFFWVREVLFLQ